MRRLAFTLALCLCASAVSGMPILQGAVEIDPPRVHLTRPEGSVQLLVSERLADGRVVDRTREAKFSWEPTPPAALPSSSSPSSSSPSSSSPSSSSPSSSSPSSTSPIATLGDAGRIFPRRDGEANLIVEVGSQTKIVPVSVRGIMVPRPVAFRTDVLPLLTKAGCNSGGCHGKAEGQNGFKLSVFGFDAEADHAALVKEGRGRRLQLAAPERSLVLRKATGEVPHGGGRPIKPDSPGYRRILRWIREGARLEAMESTESEGIAVSPPARRMTFRSNQQLRVVALDRDGGRRDVTAEAEYESNAPTIATVDERGLVATSDVPGEAAILVRYLGRVAICRISVPRPGVVFARPPENNFIDRHVWDKLQKMGIRPSELTDDATFLRRVHLDTIGTLPSPEEAQNFLNDSRPDKRDHLIRRLLRRDEYAIYWSLRWADLLRVDSNVLDAPPTVSVMRWLRRQLAENRPYDEFVRDIVTARGSTRREGPAALYLSLKDPKELSRSLSQLFLGVRIECAECHHHPFERWSQQDFVAFTGFFTGVKRKKQADGTHVVYPDVGKDLRHPRSGRPVPTAPLGADPIEPSSDPGFDRRELLAQWMTTEPQRHLARTLANRLWAHYFGRGLVEPLDDMRETNPATNEALLAALAQHLHEVKFDIKKFTHTLLSSRVYQLSAATNADNSDDAQYFSHAADRPLPAEVLLDAICQATGVPEKFNGWPAGARAIEVWDNRMPSYFFRIFGRPGRTTVCSCERSDAPSIAQALHLLNSPEVAAKIGHRRGVARRLAESPASPREIVNQIYLRMLSRFPSPKETRVLTAAFSGSDESRRNATEDVMWVVLNSKEFLYNH